MRTSAGAVGAAAPRLRYLALPTAPVRRLQAGGPDAHGQPPEQRLSDGDGVPCRHCLAGVAAGARYLLLAYRPFPALQPYAECGPIFLHAQPCERYADDGVPPPMLLGRTQLLLRGYSTEDRIVYGTGRIVAGSELAAAAQQLLSRADVDYLHVRSATNNCYQCRIERA